MSTDSLASFGLPRSLFAGYVSTSLDISLNGFSCVIILLDVLQVLRQCRAEKEDVTRKLM